MQGGAVHFELAFTTRPKAPKPRGPAAGKPGARATRGGLAKSASRRRRRQGPGKKRGAAASAVPVCRRAPAAGPQPQVGRGPAPAEGLMGTASPCPGTLANGPSGSTHLRTMGTRPPVSSSRFRIRCNCRCRGPGVPSTGAGLPAPAASQTIGSSRWLAASPPAATTTVTLVCAPVGSPAPPSRPTSSQPMFRIHRGCAALQVQAEPTCLRAAAEGSCACVLGRSERACMLA